MYKVVKIIDLFNVSGFDWDTGNKIKNKKKHNVETVECEEAFFNEALVTKDQLHSQNEDRYTAYGITNSERKLYIIFAIRNNKVRVISARDQDKKERRIYEAYVKENTQI